MDTLEKRAKAYWRYRIVLHISDLLLLAAFLVLIQLTGISGQLKGFSLCLSSNFYVGLWLYLAFLSLIYGIVRFPLDFCGSFALEKIFSLSNQGFVDWLKDEMKKNIVSFIIFSILIEAFYAIAVNFKTNWWMAATAFSIAFSIFFMKVFPVLVIPLFYKYNPVRSGSLRDKILELAHRLNIKVMDVFEIEFSKKTKKSNAAIVGWGNTRRIILADNLVNEFSSEEVEVVVAHEMAHYKLNHIWKLLASSAIATAVFFYLLSAAAGKLAHALSAGGPFDIAIFPAIWLLSALYGAAISPIQNYFSRKLERDADLMALETTRLKGPFISLMERLAEKNLSDKRPNILAEILFYDHPPIAKRIEMAENHEKNRVDI